MVTQPRDIAKESLRWKQYNTDPIRLDIDRQIEALRGRVYGENRETFERLSREHLAYVKAHATPKAS